MKIAFNRFQAIFLGISLIATASLQAQTGTLNPANVRSGESVEYCITHKRMHELQSTPGFAAQYALDQEQLRQAELQLKANPPKKRVIYKIPLVFHVLQNGGPENISDAQILDAVAILNRDYRLQNADALLVHDDFKASNPLATCTPADIEVEFVLATKAPDGTCFNGITRTFTSATSTSTNGGSNQVTAVVNGNDVYRGQWAGNKYLNIFVVANAAGAAGYTTQPNNWSATSMQNGIWILSNYVGSIGTGIENRSRALTHEVGHWLNLAHTWGNDNDPGVGCGDDFVSDTPQTKGVTSCNLNENSCGPRANVENYMDYSYCSKMFSHGQRDRMRAALTSNVGGRNNVWSSANLASVGADGTAGLCKANFTVTKQSVCIGESIQFSDVSFNGVTSRTWTFSGGTPASSNAANPSVSYTTPGTYPVTLVVSNGSNSLTETKVGFIKVLAAGKTLPYFEGFESYAQTSDIVDYQIYNSSNVASNPTFELTATAAATGSKSIKLENFLQSGTNTDEFTSDNIDLSGVTTATGATLTFKYAYRKKATANSETLKVLLSKNCGETWEQRKTISGNSLSNAVVASSWTPAAADWVTVHVTNVTSPYFVDNFRFKISFESSGGNNLFIDDINVYKGAPSDDIVLGVKELKSLNGLSLYPNPAEKEFNVSFNATSGQTLNFVMTDLLGKTIQTNTVQATSGANVVMFSTEGLAGGMYLLQVGTGASKEVLQFMVK